MGENGTRGKGEWVKGNKLGLFPFSPVSLFPSYLDRLFRSGSDYAYLWSFDLRRQYDIDFRRSR